jgi:hypothetical protein
MVAERFKETPRVDFKDAIVNLKKYLAVLSTMYGFEL